MCELKHKVKKTFEYTATATLYWERLYGLNIPNT